MPRKGPPRKFLDGKASVDLFVNVPIYGTPVLFTVYRNRKDSTVENLRALLDANPRMAALAPELGEQADWFPSGTDACTVYAKGRCLVVFVAEDDGRTVQVDNIAHECFHVAHYLADHFGFRFDQEHDEPVAYLLGWLVDALARHLMQQGFRLGAERWA